MRDGRLLAMDIDFVHRRRRVLHAVAGRALARHDPRRGSVLLSERAHSRPRRGDQHAAARRVPRVRRAAEPLRARAPHGPSSPTPSGSRPTSCAGATSSSTGQTSAVGQVMREPVDMAALLDRALALSDYHAQARALRARRIAARGSGRASASRRSCTAPASPARARITSPRSSTSRRRPTGRVRVLAASTEIGQGTNTIFSQIAADALGIDVRRRRDRAARHRDRCPTAGRRSRRAPAWSSAGWSRRRRARTASERSSTRACSPSRTRPRQFQAACRALRRRRAAPLRASSRYEPPPGHALGRREVSGRRLRRVRVGGVRRRGQRRHDDVRDARRRLRRGAGSRQGHSIRCSPPGQIEGGVAQAIGWALYEHVVWRDGRMANAQMTNYIMPTSMDLPPIRVYFEELPYAARAARREGHRRAADGRRRAGDRQRRRRTPWASRSIAIPITPEALDERCAKRRRSMADAPAVDVRVHGQRPRAGR